MPEKEQSKNTKSPLMDSTASKNKIVTTYSVFFLSVFFGGCVVVGFFFQILSMKNENRAFKPGKKNLNHISAGEICCPELLSTTFNS